MYQYVLSKEVTPPFSLCVPHLRSVLVCNDESVTPHKEVLIVVKAEDPCYDKSVLEKFTDPMVSLTWSCMCSQTYVHNNVMQHFYRRLISRVTLVWIVIFQETTVQV